jgi:hypothetical protein
MKMQYTVTIHSDMDEQTMRSIWTTLGVEINWIVHDIAEMHGHNITLKWEEAE